MTNRIKKYLKNDPIELRNILKMTNRIEEYLKNDQ